MNIEFAKWLQDEMAKRGLGVRELARLAGVSPAGISKVLNQYRGAGPDLCQALAHALDLPEEEVFLHAGLLTRPGVSLRLFSQLSPAQREVILAQMRAMIAENQHQPRRQLATEPSP
jgi:transcriptional regulator with XRE-family HTH domain